MSKIAYPKFLLNISLVLMLLFLVSCQSSKEIADTIKEPANQDYSYLEQPYPGHYKVGVPYKIDGQWYYPKDIDKNYSEMGAASWYGDGFHGNKTANGDNYNKNNLTAAHKTLPLPSMIRVTNLENGHSVIVMVNDRGPFSKDRILDVSERAAELLDFKSKGVTKVRVEYLPKQTKDLIAKLGLTTNTQKAELSETKNSEADGSCNANNIYFVQVGAYKSMQNAKHIAAKLAHLAKAKVDKIKHNTKTLYRVRLGSFVSLNEANKILDSVAEEIQSKPIIITEVGKV